MDLNQEIVTPGKCDTILKNSRGQLTIFFATTMILLITSIAFIINVGTFVKGKINLQNAVDAAAWSGAAVQSRLLTYIGYLNWELHNVHKELAYKYYVIGNRANDNVTQSMNGGGQMNFTLPAFDPLHGSYKDNYNIPTSCFNFARISTNLCTKLNVPGLPRFESAGVVGLDQTFKASVDSLTTSKSKNCADRSKINFAIALNWVYGDGKASFPQLQYTGVEQGRVGAWIRAMEIVFRIRNLESIMNLAPYTGGVCMNAGGGNACSTTVNSIAGDSALYERTVKSFWSSYRNIANDSSLASTFVLYELPLSSTASKSKTSSEGVYYGDKRTDKYYLDLRLHLINYAIFYTAFSPVSDNDIGITSEGACAGAKIALPIPFYPVGFVKSPSTLTYYAVKGVANFVGLFNPFGKAIKMEAYAAAKPFGGRIGPLNFKTNEDKVVARSSPPKSFPFASRVVPDAIPDKAGNPIPSDSGTRFWAESDSSSIGGADKNNPRFVLLNTLFVDPGSSTLQAGGNVGIYSITRGGNASSAPGLYDAYQYKKMRELPTGTAGVNGSHMPTSYDALNYLIPLPYSQVAEVPLETVPVIPQSGESATPENPTYYKIPAPLYGSDYSNMVQQTLADNALTVIEEFVSTIETYSEAMAKTAQGYYNESPTLYNEAALVIHNKFKDDKKHPECGSIAGNYYQYMTQPAGCDGQSLRKTVEDYFKQDDVNGEFRDYFTGFFVSPTADGAIEPSLTPKNFYSAYGPGNNYGGDLSGLILHPFLQSAGPRRGLRNFYSTKFIPIKSLVKGGSAYVGSFPTFSDMADTASLSNPVDMGNVTFSNSLDSVDAANISQ